MSYGRPPPRIDGMVSLKVDNLTYRTTPEDLRRVFERCGEVGDIYIPRDRFTRESRGFAFVRYVYSQAFNFIKVKNMFYRFYDKRDAEDALDAMDGRMLDGRELRVQMARYGRPTSPQRRFRGRKRYKSVKFYLTATLLQASRSRSRTRYSRSHSRSRGRRSRSRSRGRRSHSRSRSRSDSKSSRGRSRSASRDKAHSKSKSQSKSRSRSRS